MTIHYGRDKNEEKSTTFVRDGLLFIFFVFTWRSRLSTDAHCRVRNNIAIYVAGEYEDGEKSFRRKSSSGKTLKEKTPCNSWLDLVMDCSPKKGSSKENNNAGRIICSGTRFQVPPTPRRLFRAAQSEADWWTVGGKRRRKKKKKNENAQTHT